MCRDLVFAAAGVVMGGVIGLSAPGEWWRVAGAAVALVTIPLLLAGIAALREHHDG